MEKMIDYPTDYHYLVVKPNYIFYRIENDTVRIIRILNEKQDLLQILFGISSISDEVKRIGTETNGREKIIEFLQKVAFFNHILYS